MGRVIANATVLSNFVIIKRLDTLQKAVVKLYTTRKVIEEIKFGIERRVIPDAELDQIEFLEMSSEEREIFYKPVEKLGRGETSCISLIQYTK
jgi:predicted nucleic acid-binding protein